MPKTKKRLEFCIKQTTKKYMTRPSPPYSANDCPDTKMKGNDGKIYISIPTYTTGIYKWYPYSEKLIKKMNIKKEEYRKIAKKTNKTKKNK